MLRAAVALRAEWAGCTSRTGHSAGSRAGVAKATPAFVRGTATHSFRLAPLAVIAHVSDDCSKRESTDVGATYDSQQQMTSFEIPARQSRWLRAVGYGFLAEFTTVLTIILIIQAYTGIFARGLPDADYAGLGQRVGGVVGIIGGTLYTYLFAQLLMLGLSTRFVAHGIVLALTAIAFSIAGSVAGHHGVPAGYVLASVLKLAAGALAGFLYSRTASLNRNVA